MHSEGHIVAHLHITEIEHDHPAVLVSDNDIDDSATQHTTCINPGYLQLPGRSRAHQSKNHTPRTPSTTGLLEACESVSSIDSSAIPVCKSCTPQADEGVFKIGVNDEGVQCDGELPLQLGGGSELNEISVAREVQKGEDEQRGSGGGDQLPAHSRSSGSSKLGE